MMMKQLGWIREVSTFLEVVEAASMLGIKKSKVIETSVMV
jgi:hypothetical protein